MIERESDLETEELMGAHRKKVSIQGFQGCFHQIAAHQYFSENIDIIPCSTFREVTSKIVSGEADAGVIAIENSIAGSILPNYSLLQNYSLRISGEIYLLIRQNMMVMPGVSIDDVQEIHSHPMAILQCLEYIESLGRKFKLIETNDTALSAKLIADNKITNAAAIAGTLAADLFGLDIIAPDIHTVKNNFTRFLILERGDKSMPVLEADKSSVYFKLRHEKGSLLSVLRCFEEYDINMTKLQSYPIPTDPFSYLFHVDLEFKCYNDYLLAIDRARAITDDLSICGIYKHGEFK